MSEKLIPSQSKVEQDTLCAHCGYNLRGLYPQGRCPECGTDVELSLRGDLLQYADEHWLSQLRIGVKLKLWNIVLSFVGGIITSFVVTAGFSIISTLLWLTSEGLGLWATFLITMQEPRIGLTEDAVTLRKFVRGCALFSLFGGMLSFSRDAQSLEILFTIVTGIASLTAHITTVCELIYLRRFALRVPDEKLALSTKRLMWISILVFVLIFLAGLFMTTVIGIFFTSGASLGTPTPKFVGVACFTMVAMLVLFIWYIRLLMKYKDAFEVAAGEACESISHESSHNE